LLHAGSRLPQRDLCVRGGRLRNGATRGARIFPACKPVATLAASWVTIYLPTAALKLACYLLAGTITAAFSLNASLWDADDDFAIAALARSKTGGWDGLSRGTPRLFSLSPRRRY